MKRETINENLALKAPKLVTLEDKSLIYVSLMGEYGSLNYDDAYQRLWHVVKEQKLFTKGIETLCISHDDPKVTEANQQRSDVCLAIHKPAKPQDGVSCKTLAGGKYAMFAYQSEQLSTNFRREIENRSVYSHTLIALWIEQKQEILLV